MDEILAAIDRSFTALESGPALVWHYPPLPPREPLAARSLPTWPVWQADHLGLLRKNAPNWFYAEVTFPEQLAGVPLAGTTGCIYINGYCPFTLWVDGVQCYREERPWHATGPIADPFTLRLEPGRPYLLILCLEPTELPGGFNPLQVVLRALRCQELAVDVLAVGEELRLARAVARTAAERTRVDRAAAGLDQAALARQDWAAFLASARVMEERLAALAPRIHALTLHLIGHTHIDMDWQWTWKDTELCIRRDAKAVTDLLADFPELRFSLSQVPLYEAVQRCDPDVYARIQQLGRAGRWENVAATWVEGDFNMADGEAIARHLLYAADWGARELGQRARVLWAPDTFGHPGNMPQLVRLGGCDQYFHWRCNPGAADNWPARTWRGVDGSTVLALSSAYGGGLQPGHWMYSAFHNLHDYLRFGLRHAHHIWGAGDHGGGLARLQLAMLARYRALPLMPRIRFSTVAEFTAALLADGRKLPQNTGETYHLFEGCFTTHARSKVENRRCEGALLAAESLAARAGHDAVAALREAWKPVLFNQFHDLFDGAAVPDAYADVYQRAAAAQHSAAEVSAAAVATLCTVQEDGPSLTLVNPLGFPRREIVRAVLPPEVTHLLGPQGEVVPVQHDAGAGIFLAPAVPAWGSLRLVLGHGALASPPPAVAVRADNDYFTITTAHARLRLCRQSGVIGSYVDTRLGRELVTNGVPKHLAHVAVTRRDLALNVWSVVDESANPMSAWHLHDPQREELLLSGATVEQIAVGPVCAHFRITHRFRRSRLVEDLYVYQDEPRVELVATIDWQETGSPSTGIPQLKVGFTTGMSAARAHYEGPFVITQRPADGRETVTQKWADLTGDEFGFTLLNDGRYGCDALGSRLRLTVLRNSYLPDPDSDYGHHVLRLAFLPHGPGFAPGAVTRAGMAFNRPLVAARTAESTPACSRPGLTLSGLDAEVVVCTALRRAEHSGGLLVRLFNPSAQPARVTVALDRPLKRVQLVDFLEQPTGEAATAAKDRVTLRFRPHEIKTLLVPAP